MSIRCGISNIWLCESISVSHFQVVNMHRHTKRQLSLLSDWEKERQPKTHRGPSQYFFFLSTGTLCIFIRSLQAVSAVSVLLYSNSCAIFDSNCFYHKILTSFLWTREFFYWFFVHHIHYRSSMIQNRKIINLRAYFAQT